MRIKWRSRGPCRGSATNSSTTRAAPSARPRPPKTPPVPTPCSSSSATSSAWPTRTTPTAPSCALPRAARQGPRQARPRDDRQHIDESGRTDEMLSNTFAPASARRRGIVLILVLATHALMAVIGVTFATFTGQGKIGARSFAQSVLAPRPDDLMDFALQQLIADTGDVRSAIRGHSLARDMFGNDASNNGYLAGNPSSGAPFTITNFQPVANSAGLYDFQTNIPIPAADPTFYGYNFTRWILRLSYTGSAFPRPVDQTFEILYDNSQTGDMTTAFTGSGFHVFRVTPVDATTALDNPTAAAQNGLAAWQNFLVQPQAGAARFILDGRRLRAFNGPGMGAGAIYGNFRYNGGLLSGNATFTQPGDPNAVGMDEDYDACDLENWFLAIQSADGQVIIPSFHRPAAIRIDPANGYYDWGGPTNTTPAWADSASRILRPRQADGHDAATFPDLVPGPNGQITYDVDNDGDGQTDSVWVDLGYPARRNAQGQLYKPLFAFMVIGLNGRIPLNTAGNLAGQVVGIPVPPPPATPTY